MSESSPGQGSHLPRAVRALVEFVRMEAAGGIVLIAAAVLALLVANSPWAQHYVAMGHQEWRIGAGQLQLTKSLLHWVNDGLMAIFFLVVALEIKRETLSGQLAGRERLVMPLVCAAAGVVVPALLFTALNRGDAAAMRGWAVPTATDIAFA